MSDENPGTIDAVIAWTGDVVPLNRPLDATPATFAKLDERIRDGMIGGYHIRFREAQ